MKISAAQLESLAKTGMRRKEIAVAMGIKPNSVYVAMRRYGLLELWREQRYA